MRRKLGILMLVWFTLICSCRCKFVVQKKNLRVTLPESIKDVYECAISDFGVPQHSGSMSGGVVYPKSGKRLCKAFEEGSSFFSGHPGRLPVFLLADRGDCYFTLKAWNAQNAGAAAILIADFSIEPLTIMDTPEEVNPYADFVPNITIPTVLISRSLGVSIKKALDEDIVTINFGWGESSHNSDERVERNDECRGKCESKEGSSSQIGWNSVWIIFLVMVVAGLGGCAMYIYRTPRYVDSEIREIMAHYKPLDNEGDSPNHMANGDV